MNTLWWRRVFWAHCHFLRTTQLSEQFVKKQLFNWRVKYMIKWWNGHIKESGGGGLKDIRWRRKSPRESCISLGNPQQLGLFVFIIFFVLNIFDFNFNFWFSFVICFLQSLGGGTHPPPSPLLFCPHPPWLRPYPPSLGAPLVVARSVCRVTQVSQANSVKTSREHFNGQNGQDTWTTTTNLKHTITITTT